MRKSVYYSNGQEAPRGLMYFGWIALDTLRAVFRCVSFLIAFVLLGFWDTADLLEFCFRLMELVGPSQ